MSEEPFAHQRDLVPLAHRDLATRSASLARRGLEALEAHGVRIVRFPTDRSLGWLQVRDGTNPHAKWEEFGESVAGLRMKSLLWRRCRRGIFSLWT